MIYGSRQLIIGNGLDLHKWFGVFILFCNNLFKTKVVFFNLKNRENFAISSFPSVKSTYFAYSWKNTPKTWYHKVEKENPPNYNQWYILQFFYVVPLASIPKWI
jgi:hypothetical protein